MLRNSPSAWGAVSQFLHWAGTAIVLILLLHGWWMVWFAERASRFAHYQWHASLGYGALAFMILRLLWRWANKVPDLPADAARWERLAAQASHAGLYVLVLAEAVGGWALAGTFRRPLDGFFGLVNIPALVASQDSGLHERLEALHGVLAWALAALIALHIAAAIYHRFVKKDAVMQRMLPQALRGGR